MLQITEQTREEKISMYLKLTKRELAEMIVNCNTALEVAQKSPYAQVSYTPAVHPGTVWNGRDGAS